MARRDVKELRLNFVRFGINWVDVSALPKSFPNSSMKTASFLKPLLP